MLEIAIKVELIKRVGAILEVIMRCVAVNTEKFVGNYGWYYMPDTVQQSGNKEYR